VSPGPALIVIDVQRAFDDPSWGERDNPACEANIAALIEHWRERDRPIAAPIAAEARTKIDHLDRISGRIDTRRVITLKNSIRPIQSQSETDEGSVDPSMVISYARVVLQPSAEQSAALEQFLEEQRDPASPNYQHWLTPEEFADQFSVSENDANQVAAWLQSEGFSVERMARARNWIAFSGPAGQFASTFRTQVHHYRSNGALHFANATELSIPAALSGVVSEIRGLHDYTWKSPRMVNLGAVNPDD